MLVNVIGDRTIGHPEPWRNLLGSTPGVVHWVPRSANAPEAKSDFLLTGIASPTALMFYR